MEQASSIDHIHWDETLLGGATDQFTMDCINGLNQTELYTDIQKEHFTHILVWVHIHLKDAHNRFLELSTQFNFQLNIYL